MGWSTMPSWSRSVFNSLCPSEAIWQHRSGSTLVHVMACCREEPSYDVKQCWFIITSVYWYSVGNFSRHTLVTLQWRHNGHDSVSNHRWIPHTKGQYCRKCFHLMSHHVYSSMSSPHQAFNYMDVEVIAWISNHITYGWSLLCGKPANLEISCTEHR